MANAAHPRTDFLDSSLRSALKVSESAVGLSSGAMSMTTLWTYSSEGGLCNVKRKRAVT